MGRNPYGPCPVARLPELNPLAVSRYCLRVTALPVVQQPYGAATTGKQRYPREHTREADPPAPFFGPGNFLRRWFTERFVNFPVFFLTGRCDFAGGDAGLLYDSIEKLFVLPDDTILCMCHDYPPEGRSLRYDVTVREQKVHNIHVGGGTGKYEFIKVRRSRDDTLSLPALILPSIQVNIRAGHLPAAEDNEISYIKIPLNTL